MAVLKNNVKISSQTFCSTLLTYNQTPVMISKHLRFSNGAYVEFCLLGYNAKYWVECQQTFQRKTLPSSSGSKNKPRKKPVQTGSAWYLLHFGLFFGIVFKPQDGQIFLRNVGSLSKEYIILCFRRKEFLTISLLYTRRVKTALKIHYEYNLYYYCYPQAFYGNCRVFKSC
jgi:hypothetical protein